MTDPENRPDRPKVRRMRPLNAGLERKRKARAQDMERRRIRANKHRPA